MSTVRTITKNTVVLLISQIITILCAFLYNIYTARYLGSEGFGLLSFAIAFTGIFGLISDMGLSTLVTREVARNELLVGTYLVNVSIIKIALSLVTLILVAITVNILVYPKQTVQIVYIMLISTLLSNFTYLFNSIFQAVEKMEYISTSRIINSLMMLIGTIIAIKLRLNLVHFVMIYITTGALILSYNIIVYIRMFVVPMIKVDYNLCKLMLKEALPFWLTSVFVMIYFRIDMVMLSLMKGNVVVGWYAASYKLIDALNIIPVTIMTTMYPIFSKLQLKSSTTLSFAFEKSYTFLILLAMPIGVGTTLLSDKIILLLYGTEYNPSVIALKILIWASVLGFINWTPATLLNSTNRQKNLMIITLAGAIVNICLNFMLIPTMSYKGAAIATVISELTVSLLILYEVEKTQNLLKILYKTHLKLIVSVTAMSIFLLIFKDLALMLIIPLAAIVYFIALIATKTFDKQDLDIINQALKR